MDHERALVGTGPHHVRRPLGAVAALPVVVEDEALRMRQDEVDRCRVDDLDGAAPALIHGAVRGDVDRAERLRICGRDGSRGGYCENEMRDAHLNLPLLSFIGPAIGIVGTASFLEADVRAAAY